MFLIFLNWNSPPTLTLPNPPPSLLSFVFVMNLTALETLHQWVWPLVTSCYHLVWCLLDASRISFFVPEFPSCLTLGSIWWMQVLHLVCPPPAPDPTALPPLVAGSDLGVNDALLLLTVGHLAHSCTDPFLRVLAERSQAVTFFSLIPAPSWSPPTYSPACCRGGAHINSDSHFWPIHA